MKRMLSWILVLTLAVGLVPMGAVQGFATELQPQQEQTEALPGESEETVAATEEAARQEESLPEEDTVPATQETDTTIPVEEPELASMKAQVTEIGDLPENDELLDGYIWKLFYGETATYRRKAGDQLTGDEKVIYNALVPIMKQLASGQRTSTFICIGKSVTYGGEYYAVDATATFTSAGLSNEGLGRVIGALLTDLPYEMYWYDKVTGCACESLYNTSTNTMVQFQIIFAVAGNYQGSDNVHVNSSVAQTAAASAKKSQSIVSKYAGKTDYEKLVGYKNEICSLVTYDHAAADGGYFSYDDDPWQLIHVFDGISSTNVVCEGYSKAFMYLCEQTSFTDDVSCITVTGVMGGPHMWNVVTLGGKNYLVDVTNSESDCVGWDGSLFLAGGTGSVSGGYHVSGYYYTYYDETKNLWGTGSGSMLALSSEDYDPSSVHTHSYSSVVTPPTCTQQGYTTYTCTCGDSYTVSYVPALNHSYSTTVTKPTYSSEGYTDYRCTRCGYSYRGDYVAALKPATPELWVEDGVLCLGDYASGYIYEIYRSTSKTGNFTMVGWVEAGECWLQDTEATVGKTYYYKARAVSDTNSAVYSDFSNVVSMAIQCAQPYLVATNNISTGKPVLKWEKVNGAKKYEVYRSTDGVKYTKLTTTTSTSYTDSKATAGKVYAYRVRALGSKSTYNSHYAYAYAECFMAAPTLTLTTDAATGCPKLSWTKVSGATDYVVGRLISGGSEAEGDFDAIAYLHGTSYIDRDTQTGKKYTYVVLALNEDKELYSLYNPAKSVVCGMPSPTLYSEVDDNGRPVISWTPVSSAVEYKIYRSTSATKSYKLITTTTDTVYTDPSVSAGKTYYYKAVAVGDGLESAQSAYVKVTGKCAVPELTVKAGSTGKPVLTWNKISGAKKYEIWRSVDGAAFKKLTTTTKTSYTDTKATEGAECAYKVKALGSKSSYNGNFSAEDSCYVTCAAPTLTVKVDTASGKPSLSWKKVTGAAGYEIYRAINGGGHSLLTEVTGTTYLDTATEADNKYSYYVVTVGKSDVFDSVASATKTVTVTVGQPKATGTVDEDGKPVITWAAVEDAVRYKVYRSTSSSKSYKVVDTVDGLIYTDTSVSAGKTYYYKVMAVGQNSESAQSSYVKVTGKCAQPVITVGCNQDSGKPVITWSKISGAKKYDIYRSTDGESFSKLTTVTKTTYTDTKAKAGTFYYYQVRAVGSKSSYNSVFSERRGCLAVCAKPVVTVKMDTKQWKPSLSWKTVEGAVSYEIYRALRSGNFVLVDTVTKPGYLDLSAQIGDTYRYQVKAVAALELSNSESEQVQLSVPCQKTTVSTKSDPSGKPTMTWKAVEGADEYVIYRSTKNSSGFTERMRTTDTSFTDQNATKGKTYYYYVVAIAQDSKSEKSNTVKIKATK